MTKLTPEQAKKRLDQAVREAKLSSPIHPTEKADPQPSADASLEEIIAWHMRHANVPAIPLDRKVARVLQLAQSHSDCSL